jgi:predicted Zn-dependent protease
LYATAGYKPWELAWLFQDFQNADGGEVPQLLSDHPGNQQRVNALEKHLRANPSVFGKFNSDPKSARPITVPKDAAELFLH